MKHIGFNFQWLYSAEGQTIQEFRNSVDEREKELRFVRVMGCNFVRIPLDYRFFVHDYKYDEPDEEVLKDIDSIVSMVNSYGLHCCLCLHRAPGYCINGAETEKHNLWTDGAAQDAFVFLWTLFARRYASVPAELLSFDLVNEPPSVGQYGMTRKNHDAIIRRAFSAVRKISPARPVVIDGLDGGNTAMPELADLSGVTQSTRGYQPMALTHYKASWCAETKGLPPPVYPGTEWLGKKWGRAEIEKHYEPWIALQNMGVPVHVGEFGCFNKVDNRLALSWLNDVLEIFAANGWGCALWQFQGEFGICGHNRPFTNWINVDRFWVDSQMYVIFQNYIESMKNKD